MDLTKKHFDQIGEYVQENLLSWSKKLRIVENDLDFRTHSVTLFAELKHQRELMQEGFRQNEIRFKQVDERFKQVDERFKQADKRFEEQIRLTREGFEKIDNKFDKKFDRVYDFMKWQTGLGFMVMMGIYLKLFMG